MQFLVKIVKDCESRDTFRTQQNIKMELFVEKVKGFKPFIIFVKSAILDVLKTFWILNTILNTSLEALPTFSRSFILDVLTLSFILASSYILKAALENLYFLKHILEISYCNKEKITAKYRIGVILKTLNLRNDY